MRKLALLSILIIGAMLSGACAVPSTPPAEIPAPTTTAPTPTPTPAEFEIMSLAVKPSEILAGETITIIAEVKNTGGSKGSYAVVLTIDGAEVETKEVTLTPEATETVTFRLAKYVPGIYHIGIGGLNSTLTVREKPMPVPTQARVVLFWHESTGWDIITTMPLCTELGFSSSREDYAFINNEANFFDEKGKRKFDILFFAGGDANKYFAKSMMPGIDERGCQNIRKFISKGGSCIATCYSGCSIFAGTSEWIGLNLQEAMAGVKWEPLDRKYPGLMVNLYGAEPIFRGTVKGPQESNLPHPLTRFLPIKLNMENSIVKKANLANMVYLCTIGSGSLIPNPDQAMEVIGWFPNGTAAMAIVKYGDGHLYMIAPHPSMTLENSCDVIRKKTMGSNARRWGWSEEQIKEAQSALDKEGDPDGPEPDLILMKAILKDAVDRASTP